VNDILCCLELCDAWRTRDCRFCLSSLVKLE
jgi:hypothetical protein